MADQRHPESGSCERRTCLKWQPSGELSEHDFASLMDLLLVADQELHADDHCDLKYSPADTPLETSAAAIRLACRFNSA